MNSKRYDGVDHPVREVRDLREIINSSCEMFPDVDAYLEKDKPGGTYQGIKYSQVKRDMDALGTRFCDMGLKNEKIAVIGETSYYWFLTYYATVCGTGVIVPLDKNLPPEEIKTLVERSGASAIVYSKKLEKSVKGLMEDPGSIRFFISMSAEEHGEVLAESSHAVKMMSLKKLIEEGADLVHQGNRDFIDAEIDPNVMCTLIFTSGTTGQAKGVMLSHKNISSNVVNMSRREKLGDGHIVLSILPTHHTFENTCVDWTTFYQGKTLAICEGIKYITKNMNEVKANCMVGVPLVFEKIHKSIMKQAEKSGQGENLKNAIQLSRRMKLYNNPLIMKRMFKSVHEALGGEMQQFITGGAAIDSQVIKDFEAMGIPMMQGYGMTECSPIIAVNQNNYGIAESVGRPMHGTTVRIDDPDRDGVGEIVCKSPSVMLGYYENPEATEEVLRDGWLYTGDLGYMDDQGFLYVTGRKKTVIVTKGGKNIFPEEIEEVLKENSLIKEVLVHGVTDKRIGNIVITADIQPNFALLKETYGEMDSSQVYHFYKELVDKINDTMPAYKAIKRVNIREKDFEMTTTGKIKRYGNFTEGAESTGSLGYREEKAEEKRAKEDLLKVIQESDSPYYRYKEGYVVTDLRDLVVQAAEVRGANVCCIENKAGSAGHLSSDTTEITYGKLLADVNGLGTYLINNGAAGKDIQVLGGLDYLGLVSVLAAGSGIGAVELAGSPDRQESNDISDGLYVAGEKIDVEKAIEGGKKMVAQGDRQYLDREVPGDQVAIKFGDLEFTHSALAESLITTAAMIKYNADSKVVCDLGEDILRKLVLGMLLPIYSGVVFETGAGAGAGEEIGAAIGESETAEAGTDAGEAAEGDTGADTETDETAETGAGLFGRVRLPKISDTITGMFGGGAKSKEIIISRNVEGDRFNIFSEAGKILYEGYTIPECPGLLAVTDGSTDATRPNLFSRRKKSRRKTAGTLAGCPLPEMGIRIVDQDIEGIGEICVSGTGLAAGTEDWIHTGKLGYLDDTGLLYITGDVTDRFVGDGLGSKA